MRFIYSVLLLVSLILYLTSPVDISAGFLELCFSFLSLSIIIYLINAIKETKLSQNYFRPSILFLISFFIVSFQVPLDYLVGNISPMELSEVLIKSNLLSKCVSISLLGISSFFMGYYFLSRFEYKKKYSIIKYNYSKISNTILVLGSYVMFVLFLKNVGLEYLSGNYAGSVNWGKGAGIYNRFFEAFIYAAFIYKLYSNDAIMTSRKLISVFDYFRLMGFPLILVIVIYMTISIIVGDRGPVITFTLLISAGYVMKYKVKINLIYFIGLIFLFSSIFFIVGKIRNTDVVPSLSKSLEYLKFESKPSISPYTTELAGSIFPLSIAIDIVPKSENYKYGLFMSNQVMMTFPGLFGIYFTLLGYDKNIDDYLFDSAKFLTRMYLGNEATWGIGSNCIADLYLDFGFLGVMVGMLIFGLFVKQMDLAMDTERFNGLSLFSVVLFFVYFSKLFYIPRSSIVSPFSEALIVYFILILITKTKSFLG